MVLMRTMADGGQLRQLRIAVVHVIEMILTELRLLNQIFWEVASHCYRFFGGIMASNIRGKKF
jgi:hypothetical protein